MALSANDAAQDDGPLILAVSWILIVIPGLIVALRLYCKVTLSRGFGWDDGVCVFSWLIQLVYTIMVTKGVQLGVLGKHVDAIENESDIPHGLKLLYIGFVIIIFGCVFAKSSFVITLLRIVTRPWHKVILWFIMISMNALMWTCAICYLAQCKPAAALWNIDLMDKAKCWPSYVFENIAMVAGAYSGCMDVILALFPWFILWNLQMKKREKFGIIIAMSMGVFAGIAAFIKTSKLKDVDKVEDFTYYCTPILLWASAETGLTIFAASIPSLRMLFMRMRSTDDSSDDSGRYRRFPKAPNTHHQLGSYPSNYGRSGEMAMVNPPHWNDDGSNKSMLGDSRIKQTREVSVTYERTLDERVCENRVDIYHDRFDFEV